MERRTLKQLMPNVNTAVWTEMCKYFDTLLLEESSRLYNAEENEIYRLQGACKMLRRLQDLQANVNAAIQDERAGLDV
jgi:hypothetical protein